MQLKIAGRNSGYYLFSESIFGSIKKTYSKIWQITYRINNDINCETKDCSWISR